MGNRHESLCTDMIAEMEEKVACPKGQAAKKQHYPR
jgi:hypothetical protein